MTVRGLNQISLACTCFKIFVFYVAPQTVLCLSDDFSTQGFEVQALKKMLNHQCVCLLPWVVVVNFSWLRAIPTTWVIMENTLVLVGTGSGWSPDTFLLS